MRDMNNTTETTITIPVTLKGETREIEFRRIGDRDMAFSLPVFGCRIGNGAKIHRTPACAVLKNGQWTFRSNSGMALNRTGLPILAFADQIEGRAASHHMGSAIR